MIQYTHGGDVWGRGNVLDFSASLHPLGPPPQVLEAARDAVAEAVCYPDPDCRALREAIAARDGVRPGQIVCGSGAADLIYRLCAILRPRRALLLSPTFSEYEAALSLCGCGVRRYPLRPENRFDLDEGFLDAVDGVDILFLCNPNNPTGRLIPGDFLQKIRKKCEKNGAFLVVDECFLDLSGGEALTPAADVFLLRAFTKSFAIPGLRLGYGVCGDERLPDRLRAAAQPWAVSNVAQAAGIAACRCQDWTERGRAVLEQERPRLTAALRALGLTVWDSDTNFLLFRAPGVEDLRERLLKHHILIRSCGNFHGLSGEDYRICIRRREQNQRLVQALGEVL